MRNLTIAIALILLFAVEAYSQKIKLEPCEVPGTEPGKRAKVLCGSFEVYEDRVAKTGRKIKLLIHVYPATGAKKEPDPMFYIPGGPGSSATEDAPYVAEELAKIRENRDLVFVDQRGTGGSNPLVCDLFSRDDVQSYLGHWSPLDQTRRCRQELEKKADLRLYVTTIAMDDLDDVRAALGYTKINSLGASYGTRAVQTYIKRHGMNVRAAILHGVSPTGQFMPRDFPQHTERALNGVIDECLSDGACRAAFPNVRADEKAVLAKLKKGPVEADVRIPPDRSKPTRVRLSRDLAGEAVRYMLYNPGAASRIPLVFGEAAKGNFAPLAEAAIFYRQNVVATGATGLYLSITCAEDLPFAGVNNAEKQKADDETFLGDYRLRQQREACGEWPRAAVEKGYSELVHSNVPVLIMTGQWDPVTPPLYGDLVAKGLSNSIHVVVPSGGHGFGGLTGTDCITNLTTTFIRTADPRGLETSCVGSIRRDGFVLKLPDDNR